MTLTYGFFNSVNGDRVYDAEQFSSFLDGIVYDGVYQSVGNNFYVSAFDGMTISVDTGRAWFDHTWTLNDSLLLFDLPESDTVYDRIDAVVLEVNKIDRRNYIKILKGTPLENPVHPVLIKTLKVKQYPLAYITVRQNTLSINQSDITQMVDTDETPLCSGLALAGIPSGGKAGYVLAKSSSESGAVGWYHINKLPTEDWMHPTGVEDSDIIAAYRFKGAESEMEALYNINNGGQNYILSKTNQSVTWSAANGFYIPPIAGAGLENDVLHLQNVKTVAVKFGGVDYGSVERPDVPLCIKDHKNMLCVSRYVSTNNGGANISFDWPYPGASLSRTAGNNVNPNSSLYYYSSAAGEKLTDGVLSGNLDVSSEEQRIVYNGHELSPISCNTVQSNLLTTNDIKVIFGHTMQQPASWNTKIGYYIHAAILFNRVLTLEETIMLHNLMEANC